MSLLKGLNFAPILITDVFQSMKAAGRWLDLNKATRGSDARVPYVARSGGKNGIKAFLPRQNIDPPNAGKAITIGVSTSTVFYQPVPFYTSKEIQVLRHPRLDSRTGPILVLLLRQQVDKFQWGNGASLDRLRATRIMVPVVTLGDGTQAVDWEGLSALGEELTELVSSRSRSVRRTASTDDDKLAELVFAPMFVVDDVETGQAGLFHTHKGRRLTKADRRPGCTPFVTGTRMNNSIKDYASVTPIFPAGWVTLIYNGDGGTGHAKYQPAPFNASDDVIVLEPLSPEASEDALLVLVTILTRQCVSKFNFGYKLTLDRLLRQRIMAPVTIDTKGEQVVDWSGMATYGRALRVRAERALDPDKGVAL